MRRALAFLAKDMGFKDKRAMLSAHQGAEGTLADDTFFARQEGDEGMTGGGEVVNSDELAAMPRLQRLHFWLRKQQCVCALRSGTHQRSGLTPAVRGPSNPLLLQALVSSARTIRAGERWCHRRGRHGRWNWGSHRFGALELLRVVESSRCVTGTHSTDPSRFALT